MQINNPVLSVKALTHLCSGKDTKDIVLKSLDGNTRLCVLDSLLRSAAPGGRVHPCPLSLLVRSIQYHPTSEGGLHR